MDPAAIGDLQWSEIGKLLTNLWVVVLLVILSATNILLGHNFIPSLLATGDLPASAQKARPVLYLLAIACFGLALFFLAQTVSLAGVLRDFWASYWI